MENDEKNTAQSTELRRVLGLGDLMGIGVGQIIGSGIMALTGITIAITGAGTPLAFIVAAILVICPNLVLAVLGSAVPATGGMYTYVRDYIGPKTGFFYLALLVAGGENLCQVLQYYFHIVPFRFLFISKRCTQLSSPVVLPSLHGSALYMQSNRLYF